MFRKKLICPGEKMGGGGGVVKIVWDIFCNVCIIL